MKTDIFNFWLGEEKKSKKSKKCSCEEISKSCDLTTIGTYCDANDFILSKTNLPYEKCQNFPKIIKNFVQTVGLSSLIGIAETIPTDGDRAAAINEQYAIIENFIYKGYTFNIRLTLTKSDGKVIYDSVAGTTDAAASSLQLHTTRMEIQRAGEREWGAMKRTSGTINGTTYVYASIWIPHILLISEINDLNVNTEVINFRLAYQVDTTGKPLPNS
jgi:hypothetical protein